MKKKRFDRRGIALIVTIVMLIMLTLLLVGMVTMTRLERRAASSYESELGAEQMAQAGVMRVIAMLKATLPATLDNNDYYISMPGKVIGVTNGISTVGTLFSTSSSGTDTMDLNATDITLPAPILSTTNDFYTLSGGIINAGTYSITAGWIYAYDASGRVIGRFAYWTDDNACRINLNTARTRSVPASGAVINTQSVDFSDTGTSGGMRDFTTTSITNVTTGGQGTFSTPEYVKLASAGVTNALYEKYKFYFTTSGTGNYGAAVTGAVVNLDTAGGYSISYRVPANVGVVYVGGNNFGVARFGSEAELDVFGRPRLNFNQLTVTSTNYPTSNICPINDELFVRLSSIASITTGNTFTPQGNWSSVLSGIGSSDFNSKYSSGQLVVAGGTLNSNSAALQLMANLIDFTQSSTTDCTHSPISTLASSGSHQYLPTLNQGTAYEKLGYLGLKTSPYLNQIVLNTVGTYTLVPGGSGGHGSYPGSITFNGAVFLDVELINPYDVAVGNNYMILYNLTGTANVLINGSSTRCSLTFNNENATIPNVTSNVNPNSYKIFTFPLPWNPVSFTGSGITGSISYVQLTINRVRLLQSASVSTSLRDYLASETFLSAQCLPSGYGSIGFPAPAGTITTPSVSLTFSLSKNDPRVPTSWFYTPGANLHGGISSVTAIGSEYPGGPSGSQSSGAILTWNTSSTTASVLNWNEGGAVATQSKFYIQGGAISSLGYLGFVHTGQPWRTLRLQPSVDNSIPDWALLDMFKLNDAYTTITPVTGRININQQLFDASGSPPRRIAPLMAVMMMTNASAWGTWSAVPGTLTPQTTATLTTLANAVINTLQAGVNTTNFVSGSNTFPLAGAICEIGTLANGGTTEAERESMIRAIAPLLTTRSRYFTVWSIGQSLKKVDTTQTGTFLPGVDLITGESRVQAIIERDPIQNAYRIVYLKFTTD